MVLAAIAVNVAQVGFLFLPARLAPDVSRLSLLKGFGRLFSVTNAARLAFGIFKILVIAGVTFASLYGHYETILGLAAMDVELVFADRNERQRILLVRKGSGWAVTASTCPTRSFTTTRPPTGCDGDS